MLVLSRHKEGLIHIGNDITVKVVSIKNGVVKLGIDAPKDVSIQRGEVRLKMIADENYWNKQAMKRGARIETPHCTKCGSTSTCGKCGTIQCDC